MSLPAFDHTWRDQQRVKPCLCVLEVRDRETPNGELIARLFVQRQETVRRDPHDGEVYEASIRLSYETIEPKHSIRSPVGGCFSASYSRGLRNEAGSVSLVNGGLFFDPYELRGQRIGTYLMNEIVAWAQQWPDATVRPIKLLSGQADDENRSRRNRFYERFGLVFIYHDQEHREGVSKQTPVKALTRVESWQENIRERNVRDYLSEVLYERDRLVMEATQRDSAIKNLSKALDEAGDRPVRWAARRLWWRFSPIVVQGVLVLASGALIWVGLRGR